MTESRIRAGCEAAGTEGTKRTSLRGKKGQEAETSGYRPKRRLSEEERRRKRRAAAANGTVLRHAGE